MKASALERCESYLSCQFRGARGCIASKALPFVTISREAGTVAMTVAEKLADYLQEHDTESGCAWEIYNHRLITQDLESHHRPARLAEFMREDRIPELEDLMLELFTGHPPFSTLLRELEETIRELAKKGRVIFIGRAANLITDSMEGGFHVRLVGSKEKRIERLQASEGMTREQAEQFVRNTDRARSRFVQAYFRLDVADPRLYDLVINTDRLGCEEIAEIIGRGVLARQQALGPGAPSVPHRHGAEIKDVFAFRD